MRNRWSYGGRKEAGQLHSSKNIQQNIISADDVGLDKDANNVTRRVVDLTVPDTRRRGRPKKTWHQQIKDEMTDVGVTQDMALHRKQWRRRTMPTPRI